MTENFRIEPDAADTAGRDLASAGRTFLHAQDALRQVFADTRGCFGNDTFGQTFVSNYTQNADDTATTGKSIANSEVGVGEFIRQLVDAFVDTDDGNARRLDHLVGEDVEKWHA